MNNQFKEIENIVRIEVFDAIHTGRAPVGHVERDNQGTIRSTAYPNCTPTDWRALQSLVKAFTERGMSGVEERARQLYYRLQQT